MASPDLSADEGEISEAIPLPRSDKDDGVDRNGRNRGSFSRTPDLENSRDGSCQRRSRSPRGFKRPHNDRDRRDPRHFRVHYEHGGRDDRRHGRDLDRPASRGSYSNGDGRSNHQFGNGDTQNSRQYGYREDDRRHRGGYDRDRHEDGYSAKRPRNRSRSPRDRGGTRERRDRLGSDSLPENKYSTQAERYELDGAMSKRAAPGGQAYLSSSQDTKSRQGVPVERGIKGLTVSQASGSLQPPSQNPAPEPDFDWEPEEKDQEAEMEAEIERRRRAREAAYKRGLGATAPAIQALQASERGSSTPDSTRRNSPAPPKTEANTPQSNEPSSPGLSPPRRLHEAPSPATFGFPDDQALTKVDGEKIGNQDGPSAADYDPTADMKEDERRDEMRHGNVGLHGEARHPRPAEEAAVADEQPKQSTNADADDDDFDMFAEEFDEEKFAATAPKRGEANDATQAQTNGVGGGIVDGDDKDGYYKIRPGEIVNGYRFTSTLGKGMFSGVARAEEVGTKRVVAIKIMRNNDALRKGGFTEIAILQKLNSSDPDDRKHIVRFERSFEYKGHLCMVFENLDLNLREVLKKYGNNVGINLDAVRQYARQIFIGLGHMRKSSIIHADLKPDNILVNEKRTVLKICDLGTAIDRSDAATASNEITPYLVSRFYRAPEVILGIPYDYAIDMWSIGCTLYELYTGKILFTGSSNNQMLKNIQDLRGKLNTKLLRRGQLSINHFDEQGNFISIEPDKIVPGNTVLRTISAFHPANKLRDRVIAASSGADNTTSFINLLEKCLAVNPEKRITPQEALRHEFFMSDRDKLQAQSSLRNAGR